jgi:hypothetical protein
LFTKAPAADKTTALPLPDAVRTLPDVNVMLPPVLIAVIVEAVIAGSVSAFVAVSATAPNAVVLPQA